MSMYEPQSLTLLEDQAGLEDPRELDFARTWIASVKFRTAKTPQNPHQYFVRSWEPDRVDEFDAFEALLKQRGYKGVFIHQKYSYLNIDEFRYWASRSFFGVPGDRIINRCRLDANAIEDDQDCCALGRATAGKHHAKSCVNFK